MLWTNPCHPWMSKVQICCPSILCSTLSREVKVVRGSRGYGFAMRGVRGRQTATLTCRIVLSFL